MDEKHTLCKKERLCGKQTISDLFGNGNAFFLTPFKVFWLQTTTTEPYRSRSAVSVPKRRFKLAVKRNLMKRRTREAFRQNKQILNATVEDGQQVQLMLIYASDELLSVATLQVSIKKILHRIAQQYAKSG